eukprot:TRINITY_DN317_c0_g1_i1.p1 TRINITY_DN317_c0_g1~~TRINITY_DN317_c0_g1_i1.p1  ORF type:complete len:245 (-),score=-1.19 TRINITY_DN317_c0_g1_i1:340-975(-)
MSDKHCAEHKGKRKRFFRFIWGLLLTLLFIILFVIFVIWLVLRPSKPSFSLQQASVYQFNLSSPNILTTRFQVTIVSRNPNDRVGIYYDRLDVYASYQNQQITPATGLPRTYQGHDDVTVWSPFLYGDSVPISPYVALSLNSDTNGGVAQIIIRIDGRLRWKVGTWTSGRYHIHVSCSALVSFNNQVGDNVNSNGVGPFIRSQQGKCSTSL